MFAVKVLGVCVKEEVEFCPYKERSEITYKPTFSQIGIVLIEADSKEDALVRCVKNCAEYYNMFNNAKRTWKIEGSNLTNPSQEVLKKLPEWLLNYFSQRFIMGYATDFQSLDFKLCE